MMGMMEQDDQSNQMNYNLAAFPVDLSIGADEHCIAQMHTVRPEESQVGIPNTEKSKYSPTGELDNLVFGKAWPGVG